MTPAEASKRFFQGAMHMWTSAPDFKGIETSLSLNDWFNASLRDYLPLIARRKGAALYLNQLSEKVELAYLRFEEGHVDEGRAAMVELLDLIHKHLNLPTERQLTKLSQAHPAPKTS